MALFILAIGYVNEDVFIKKYNNLVRHVEVKTSPVLFVGDIMLGRYVESLIKKNGTTYPFSEINDILKSHTTIANLEGPIPEVHVQTPLQGFQFSFSSSTALLLKENGIQAVSLANNHSQDWGQGGYANTKKILDSAGVGHFGAYGKTSPDYFETKVGTTSVIVFGINMVTNTWYKQKAIQVASDLHREHGSSTLVAYIHWGEEYQHAQGALQRSLAHELIDNGVDIIVGMHPHVVQGIETYKSGIIFYSLGNFIFDQYFSKDTQESYMISFDIKNSKNVFTLIPLVSERSIVRVATGTRAAVILETISNNSEVKLQNDINDRGVIVIP